MSKSNDKGQTFAYFITCIFGRVGQCQALSYCQSSTFLVNESMGWENKMQRGSAGVAGKKRCLSFGASIERIYPSHPFAFGQWGGFFRRISPRHLQELVGKAWHGMLLWIGIPPPLSRSFWRSQCLGLRCEMGMDQYLLIPFLGGWTSIYQLFWCEQKGYYWFWHTAIWKHGSWSHLWTNLGECHLQNPMVSWSPCHDIWWMSSTTGLRFERRTLVSDVHILIYIYILYFSIYISISILFVPGFLCLLIFAAGFRSDLRSEGLAHHLWTSKADV